MTHAVEPNGVADPALGGVPRQLAALLRPELDSLAEEIITEIRRNIPEYARPIDGPYGQALRVGVGMAISAFVDQVGDPGGAARAPRRRLQKARAERGTRRPQHGHLAGRVPRRRAGGLAAHHEGGQAQQLLIGHHVAAGRRPVRLPRRARLDLAGRLHRGARRVRPRRCEEWRRRLLHLILECAAVPDNAISELAALARWQVPTDVTLVAATSGASGGPAIARRGHPDRTARRRTVPAHSRSADPGAAAHAANRAARRAARGRGDRAAAFERWIRCAGPGRR